MVNSFSHIWIYSEVWWFFFGFFWGCWGGRLWNNIRSTVGMRGTVQVGCTGWEIPCPVITAEVIEVSKWNGKENAFNLVPNTCIPHMPASQMVTDWYGWEICFVLSTGKEWFLLLLHSHYAWTMYSFQKTCIQVSLQVIEWLLHQGKISESQTTKCNLGE